jgi:hypothetical protein
MNNDERLRLALGFDDVPSDNVDCDGAPWLCAYVKAHGGEDWRHAWQKIGQISAPGCQSPDTIRRELAYGKIVYSVYRDLDGVYPPCVYTYYPYYSNHASTTEWRSETVEVVRSLTWTPWNNVCIMYGLEYLQQTNDVVGVADDALAAIAVGMCGDMMRRGINSMSQAYQWAVIQRSQYQQLAAKTTGRARIMNSWFASFFEATMIGLGSNPLGF